MRDNIRIDDKMQGETRRYGFDWAPYLASGDTIEGEPAQIDPVYGEVAVESNTKNGAVQTFELSGGVKGPVALRLEINTTQGGTLQAVVVFSII